MGLNRRPPQLFRNGRSPHAWRELIDQGRKQVGRVCPENRPADKALDSRLSPAPATKSAFRAPILLVDPNRMRVHPETIHSDRDESGAGRCCASSGSPTGAASQTASNATRSTRLLIQAIVKAPSGHRSSYFFGQRPLHPLPFSRRAPQQAARLTPSKVLTSSAYARQPGLGPVKGPVNDGMDTRWPVASR